MPERLIIGLLAAASPACLSALLSGCAALREPDVRVQSVTLTDRTAEVLAVQIEVILMNPNDKPLELQNMKYRVTLTGAGEFHGKRAALQTLPANGRGTLLIPAIIEHGGLGGSEGAPQSHCQSRLGTPTIGMDCAIRGRLRYRAPGALEQTLFGAGVRKPSVAIRGESKVVSGHRPGE